MGTRNNFLNYTCRVARLSVDIFFFLIPTNIYIMIGLIEVGGQWRPILHKNLRINLMKLFTLIYFE